MSVIQETAAHQQASNTWQSMSPRMAFLFGLISAIAASSVLGLVVVLSVLLRNPNSAVLPGAPSPLLAAAPTGQAPQPANPGLPSEPVVGPVKPVDPKVDHIRGDKNADVFVIEYSDFECPFCKRHHPTMQQLVDQNKGKVAWVYRHYPLNFHANAQKEAEASECANELGGNDAFWKYTDKIFERTTSNGTGFSLDALIPLAKEIGLNESKFKSCLDSGKYAQHVQQDTNEGTAAGITGTPGNIVWTKNGKSQMVSGAVPLSVLQAAVDQVTR